MNLRLSIGACLAKASHSRLRDDSVCLEKVFLNDRKASQMGENLVRFGFSRPQELRSFQTSPLVIVSFLD